MENNDLCSVLKSFGYSAPMQKVFFREVENSNYSLANLDGNLRKNRKIVLWFVERNGTSLEYASEELRADKEVALVAVRNTGFALKYTTPELTDDFDVVSAAVLSSGASLKYASARLRDDEDMCLRAFHASKFGWAFSYVSERLKNKKEVVLSALLSACDNQACVEIFKHASDEIKGLVGNQDPLFALQTIIEAERLDNKIDVSCRKNRSVKV